MTHPLVPQVIDLAIPVAADLGLEIVGAVFRTNQSPPVLQVNVRNPQQDTGLDDCERLSRSLEAALDEVDLIPDAYVLEVSSPGVSRTLTSDRDFLVFKGFAVEVMLREPYQGKRGWVGKLVLRDDDKIRLNRKGRTIALPRDLVESVDLSDSQEV
jgi:ribosome maturation factor RimP